MPWGALSVLAPEFYLPKKRERPVRETGGKKGMQSEVSICKRSCQDRPRGRVRLQSGVAYDCSAGSRKITARGMVVGISQAVLKTYAHRA